MFVIPAKRVNGFMIYWRDRRGETHLPRYIVYDTEGYDVAEFRRLREAVRWCEARGAK